MANQAWPFREDEGPATREIGTMAGLAQRSFHDRLHRAVEDFIEFDD